MTVCRERKIYRDWATVWERGGREGRGGRGKKLINTLHAEDLKGRFGDEVSMNFKEHKKGWGHENYIDKTLKKYTHYYVHKCSEER